MHRSAFSSRDGIFIVIESVCPTALQGFDVSDYSTQIAGEIKHFSGAGYIDRKAERRLDACIKYAMVAGKKVRSAACALPRTLLLALGHPLHYPAESRR